MSDPIRVLVNGARGKMGKQTCIAVDAANDLLLVAQLNRGDDVATALEKHKIDVAVDFTVPNVVFDHTKTYIDANVHPVIGTTGLDEKQIKELQVMAREKKLGGIIAPNFSIGAILMMHFAKIANRFLSHAEIIEMHHEKKLDAPSGTALKTVSHMQTAQLACEHNQFASRGLIKNNIPIHSVRLPGYVAHQQVILSGEKELLTLRHDSIDRSCFMPGVVLACRQVQQLDELVFGLENLLDL